MQKMPILGRGEEGALFLLLLCERSVGFSSLKCGKKHERGQAVGEGTPLLRSGVGKAGVKPGEGQLK